MGGGGGGGGGGGFLPLGAIDNASTALMPRNRINVENLIIIDEYTAGKLNYVHYCLYVAQNVLPMSPRGRS